MKIFAFSRPDKKIIDDLEDVSAQLIKHLIKIWLYPDNQANNHWKKEVAAFLSDVPKVKPSNRFPKKAVILKHTWYEENDRIPGLISNVKGFFYEDPVDVSNGDIYQALDEYFNWIATELSSKGTVDATTIYDKIEELRKKHIRSRKHNCI